jgi:hypothetical protein
VPRTVSVTVPVPTALPTMRRPPSNMPCLAGSPCPTPVVGKPMPVQVEVAVRPELCDKQNLAPVIYRDPGFFLPVISSAASLTGAVIAAPFRFLETLVPLDCPRRCGRPCGMPPPAFLPNCMAPAPLCPPVIAKCGPPPCMGQPVCAPVGPSVAPLPLAKGPACGPFIPPMLVAQQNEEPPCEPQSLLGGIVNFPSRILDRGRFFGDMGAISPRGQCH